MKLKFALSLIALLASAAGSQAAFQITLTVGSDIRTIVDGGAGDEDANPNSIFVSSLPDVGPAGALFNWSGITASVGEFPGIDGAMYAMDIVVSSVRSQAAAPTNGTVISIYGSVNDLPSLVGEPLASSGSVTIRGKSTTGASGTENIHTAAYDARYNGTTDPSQVTTTPSGLSQFAGNASRTGIGALAYTLSDLNPQVIGPATLSEYSMGLLMGSTIAWTSAPTAKVYDLTFSGGFQIQQVPEPSQSALPVGIAVGLVGMRRRRVTR